MKTNESAKTESTETKGDAKTKIDAIDVPIIVDQMVNLYKHNEKLYKVFGNPEHRTTMRAITEVAQSLGIVHKFAEGLK